MSDESDTLDVSLLAAEKTLSASSALVETITQRLAAKVAKDGRVSQRLLDEHQLDAFRFATMVAEVRAAESILDYAKTHGGPVPTAMAVGFIAEVAQSLLGEARTRRRSWGLTEGELRETLDRDDVLDFIDGALDGQRAEVVWGLIQENGSGPHGLDDERDMIRKEFRKFAEQKVMPVAEHVHRHDDLIPKDIINGVAELGCFGLSIPEQYGGLQPDDQEDNLGMCIVTEELSRGSLGVAGSLITRPEILSKALLAGGTEEQRHEWLPKLATGEILSAVAVTEPDFGSDVAGMKVTATKVDGGWHINGVKTWCTFAGFADTILVLARTEIRNPGAQTSRDCRFCWPKSRGSTSAINSSTSPGRRRQDDRFKAIGTIGYRGMHSFEVSFEDWFVPDENLIGGEEGRGKGFYLQMAGLRRRSHPDRGARQWRHAGGPTRSRRAAIRQRAQGLRHRDRCQRTR